MLIWTLVLFRCNSIGPVTVGKILNYKSFKPGEFLPFSRGRILAPIKNKKIATFFPNSMSVFPNFKKSKKHFFFFYFPLETTSTYAGFQLDWNSLRTFCPSSPNIVRTFGNFLGHFFRHSFYHHKPKLLSALLIMKTGVVLLPFRMVGAAGLIGWLFI